MNIRKLKLGTIVTMLKPFIAVAGAGFCMGKAVNWAMASGELKGAAKMVVASKTFPEEFKALQEIVE